MNFLTLQECLNLFFRENNLVDIIHENINLLKELDNSIDIVQLSPVLEI